MKLERTVRIGIAVWSYPDWKGIVYPQERPPGFSELRYLAERFDYLEINTTFYRQPTPSLTAK